MGFMNEREELQRAVWKAHPDVRHLWHEWESSVGASNRERTAKRQRAITYNNPLEAAAAWARQRTDPEPVPQPVMDVLEGILRIDTVLRYHCCSVGMRYMRSQQYEQKMTTQNSCVYKTVRPAIIGRCGVLYARLLGAS